MKRIITAIMAAGFLAAFASGCDREHTIYSDAEYVMFADTMSVHLVPDEDDYYFSVKVAATTACSYDRTLGVEIIDKESKAIEGVHYSLKSSTITIPAGKLATEVLVHGYYDKLERADTMNFRLRLVMPEQLEWGFYGNSTHVKMVKSCPFVLEEYTGWCLATSLFLRSYPGVENTSIQRLIRTEKHPTEENTVILKNWLFTGYDVNLRFDPSDPANPTVSMDEDQVVSNELSVFGIIRGDDKILVTTSPAYVSSYSSCGHFVTLWGNFYVKNLGSMVGSIGNFYNVMEGISDEDADRLQREEG
ncbi:MAG: DUF4984 domain-containing protein, partial [Alistipes sp.]|nr:DUF4984 domain-containing protein [Alistipes sp.]